MHSNERYSIRHSRIGKKFALKSGVSLVTVLLFMLVATIAATATYKWLTSEGRSSASRMMKREAYQSAVAGIENARAWMTFHANETGALIAQYIYDANDKPKTTKIPINMDDRIRSFAQGSSQDHHVWLVGVNTEKSTYKVKILSEGRSRNGQARHTEVAIFNVDGLYQVNKPKKEEEFTPEIEFKFNYFGGSTTTGGNIGAYSLLVNGNLLGANPVYSETDLIVTGNLIMSASGVGAGGTTCVGGDFDGNNGAYGKDFYIGGNATHFTWPTCPEGLASYNNPNINQIQCSESFPALPVTGDVYINGNLSTGPQHQEFPRNLTLNGTWKTNFPGYRASVGGDLCVGEHGKIVVNETSKTFSVEGNVWMPGDTNFWLGSLQEYGCLCTEKIYDNNIYTHWQWKLNTVNENVPCGIDKTEYDHMGGHKYEYSNKACEGMKLVGLNYDNYDYYDKIILGNKTDSKVFIKTGRKFSDYETLVGEKKVTTHDTQVRNCKEGDCHGPTKHENWKNEDLYPYPQKEEKDGLHYIYVGLPTGVYDVGFGEYTDSFWNRNIHGFFVDFTGSGNESNRFTDSYAQYASCNDKPNQPNLSSKKCYRYLNFENNRITGSPYCRAVTTGTDAKMYVPRCGVAPWFKSNGDVKNAMPSPQPFNCAENVKTKCLETLGSPTTGCDGASYKVNDLLVTAYNSFRNYANLGCNVTAWSDDLGEKLNACLDNNSPENLYKGYQVVEITSVSKKDPFTELDGDFIIIITQSSGEAIALPPTTETSHVLVYLPNGYSGDIVPACPSDKRTSGDCTGSTYNYFVYTAGDVTQVLFNQDVFSGSVYAEVGESTCAKVGKFQSRKMEFNEELLKHLEKHEILCKRAPCGAEDTPVPGDDPENSTDDYVSGDKDPHFISNAPQLGVTLESQYESSETIPAGNGSSDDLAKSFIVLPRIIYLNKDPVGKLSDYFNVIPLNGANVTKSTANVSCSPSLNVNSNLVSDGSKLTEGIYECKAAPNGLKKVDFWVWVQGSQQSSPPIYFVEQSKNLSPNENHEVKIDLPPHATEIMVKVDCPDAPTGWPNYTIASNGTRNGDVCTFTFPADASNHDQPTLFTVSAPSEPTNGTLVFSLQQPEPNAGYKLGSPTTTSLIMASTATLNNTQDVSLSEINTWCATHSGCPAQNMRSSWPDCPYKTTKEWVAPDWTPGSVPNLPNISWSIVSGTSGTLKLKEKESSGCIVIIPEENNSRPAPIEADSVYTLRAIAKAKSHKVTLQFVGTVADNLNPFVSVKAGERDSIPCNYNDKDDHSCVVSVFDGENVKIGIDDEDTQNKGFSYWKCDNNGGSTCPSTDPISSKDFSDEGFTVKDDNAIVYIHFGERDKHCFFDEFRRGNISCGTETEYCIDFCSGTCANATSVGDYPDSKWNLIAGSASNIETSSYPGYVVAAKNTPNTGVKVMSTVQAGVRGTLRTLFQVPHATASYGRETSKIKNSGFMLRADASGSEYLMLNVYENASGYLEAQLCLVDGGSTGQCRHTEFIRNGSRAGVTPSSMVMLVADLRNQNVLQLKAFTGRYYYNSSDISETAYTAEFNDLSDLGNNHANMTFQYVGFSLAHRDFKIYGIGWESEDYGSECFDGPPTVKCSFAAVATNGVIPTDGSGEGQSSAFQKPWVGHSGWFDSQNCSPTFTYVTTGASDATVSESEGYKFDQSGAGAHGFKEKNADVKTAKASLSCSPSSEESRAWAATAELAHCGPFWTGKYTECKNDIADLLAGTPLYIAGSIPEGRSFDSKNLRGLEKLEFTISNESESEVDLEVWLESQSDSWGSSRYSSRHERITGNTNTITREFDVVSAFGDNATGFDPENVVGVMFRNNGGSPVTVNQIVAPCRNTVKFNGCSVERNGETGWKVTIDVSKNPDKLSKIYLKETGAGITIPNSGEFDYEGNLTLSVSDASIYSNAGKTYAFSARVYSETNAFTSEWATCTCADCEIGAITCKNASITATEIEVGKSSPQFHFELSGCPPKGCAYEVKLNETKLTECTNAQAASTDGCPDPGEHNVTAPKQTPTDLPAEYTYSVVNPTGSATTITNLDKCTKTFKIVEKAPDPVTCSFTSVTSSASGSDLGQSINISNPTVSCDGGGCKYSVKEGTTTIKSYTDYSDDYGFSFDGATEAGSHTYKVYMQRGSEQEVECTGSYTVTYPLNLSCGTFPNPGATTPIPIGDPVTPASPTVPSSEYSGCNNKCSYAVTGGGSVSGGSGSNTDGTTVSSFTDASASGTGSSFTVNYTLTVSLKDGVTPLTCTLPVTYASGGGSGSGCHCADYCGSGCENNITTGTVYHNSDGWSGCVFLTSASRINNSNGYTINGTPITENGNLCYGDEAACASKLAAYEPVDGGWYFKIDNIYTDIISSGYNPCAEVSPASISACSVAKTIVAPNADVTVAMTTTNCNVLGGCDYKISADGLTDKTGNFYSGNITFPGESSESHTYSLYIKNSANATWVKCPSTFAVTYSSDAYVDAEQYVQYNGPKKLQYSTSGTCSIDASANTWNTWVTGTVSGYWDGTNGQINGAIKVDVPSGEWFKVNNCW